MSQDTPVTITDLDAASFIVAHGHKLQGVEKAPTGLTVFRFSPDVSPLLASFYSGGLVNGQAMGAALRQLKKTIHTHEDTSSHATRRSR